ncbi:MAG: DUF5615 family PIN-like protein [Phycisphaeraceae bacterium]|nr:DUF5615 family PIN-like protein [Phycisphaeraceae bacterium]
MKLLLDQNLSTRLLNSIEPVWPGSSHIRLHDLDRSGDSEIWEFARESGFAIVTKDADFRQLALVWGAPPKVILVLLGNCTTGEVAALLLRSRNAIMAFGADPDTSVLVLTP